MPEDQEEKKQGTEAAGGESPRVEEPGSESRPVKEKETPEVQKPAPAADQPPATTTEDAEKEAKAKAAAEARAARAAARAAAQKGESADGAEAAPKEPSPKQPLLDRFVTVLREEFGENAVLEAFINERDDHLPCVVLQTDLIRKAAALMSKHPEFQLNYLRNVAGSDLETHMEVIYHVLALDTMQEYCFKVKTDRNQPVVPSVTPVWATANWNEREIYDLLGIDFPGHPDLRRIMLPDDWVGHPLRKDYEPLDPEV